MRRAEWIRRAIDGELSDTQLRELEVRCERDPDLAAELARARWIAESLADLHEAQADPVLTDRIMGRVRKQAVPFVHPWWMRPIPAVVVLFVALVIGGIVGFVLGAGRMVPSTESVPLVAHHPPDIARHVKLAVRPPRCEPEIVVVQFRLLAKKAQSVALVGDFNGWRKGATRLEDPEGDGIWRIQLRLKRGTYNYAFLVDGKQWVPDPSASRRSDGFGGSNSVISL